MASSSTRAEHNPYLIIAVVTLGNFIGPLYSSVANVLVPTLIDSFHAGVETMEWTVAGFMLGYSIVMPIAGWLSDTFGRRRVFLAGLAIFTLSSICAAFAWSATALIAFRILQAAGGGLISPTGLAIVSDVVPLRQRGRAFGLWAMGVMLAPAFGPWVSGLILDSFGSWRPVFLLGVPFGIAAFAMGYIYLPHRRAGEIPRAFDALGFVTLAIGVTSFLVPVTQASRVGWADGRIWLSLGVAACAFTFFVSHELRTPAPMLDLSLFRDRGFAAAVALRGVIAGGYYVPVFLLPLFGQQLLGWSATEAGAIILPAGLTLALIMPLSGLVSDRIGARIVVLAGMALSAFGTFLFTGLDGTWSIAQFTWYNIVRNGAIGLIFTPLTAAALANVPRARAGSASAIINTIWQLGGSVAIAIAGAFWQYRAAASTQLYAYRDAFWAGACVLAVSLPLALFLQPRAARIAEPTSASSGGE
jgi:DHA2 family multidrug resistance protein